MTKKKKKKTHEKMFNIISHQVNTNQNHKEVSLHTMALIEKTVTGVGKDVEKSEPSHFILLVRMLKWCSYFGKQSDHFSKC